ncbi:unnamed protein product [Cyclocybe aegerita]|uniref:DUF6535 domain-containing protein n=1 Tax=Cyclocybe aegerita TaxID=1973307 RepID=A0A8S0Y0H2_CYCAE|nr:unnamed protein product [Cyclocybe aegerita]
MRGKAKSKTSLSLCAGLFSAVVTAFVVESCKFLLPDSSDASIVLLTLISEQLERNSSTTTPISPTISQVLQTFSLPQTPSPSTVRVNVFWFLSLVLSWTTVLIGIVSLQWLREHQRYGESLTPRKSLAIFHMRAAASEDWHVQKIFAALPLLLQVALVLFFAGIIDFILSL